MTYSANSPFTHEPYRIHARTKTYRFAVWFRRDRAEVEAELLPLIRRHEAAAADPAISAQSRAAHTAAARMFRRSLALRGSRHVGWAETRADADRMAERYILRSSERGACYVTETREGW